MRFITSEHVSNIYLTPTLTLTWYKGDAKPTGVYFIWLRWCWELEL